MLLESFALNQRKAFSIASKALLLATLRLVGILTVEYMLAAGWCWTMVEIVAGVADGTVRGWIARRAEIYAHGGVQTAKRKAGGGRPAAFVDAERRTYAAYVRERQKGAPVSRAWLFDRLKVEIERDDAEADVSDKLFRSFLRRRRLRLGPTSRMNSLSPDQAPPLAPPLHITSLPTVRYPPTPLPICSRRR